MWTACGDCMWRYGLHAGGILMTSSASAAPFCTHPSFSVAGSRVSSATHLSDSPNLLAISAARAECCCCSVSSRSACHRGRAWGGGRGGQRMGGREREESRLCAKGHSTVRWASVARLPFVISPPREMCRGRGVYSPTNHGGWAALGGHTSFLIWEGTPPSPGCSSGPPSVPRLPPPVAWPPGPSQ